MIRVTIELNAVLINGDIYMSTMHQSAINKYQPSSLQNLEEQTQDSVDDAENEVFVYVGPSIDPIKAATETQRHFPYAKIERVEQLTAGHLV